MRNFKHPISSGWWEGKTITKDTCFVTVEGDNFGAFPRREKNGVRFDCENGIFHITIHEWKTALRYDLFRPKRIVKTINVDARDSFKKFVDHFYNSRIQAKNDGDSIRSLFYKYILNSAYGKFAQNPANYFSYKIGDSFNTLPEPWIPKFIPNPDCIVWGKPSEDFKYFNVATAASITGAARSVLMEAIALSKRLIYCDTDSIICESTSITLDNNNLGSWKLEGSGNMAAIAGKKLYAIFDGKDCIKKASKGVRLSSDEIVSLCKGETIESVIEAPSFKLGPNESGKLSSDTIQHTFIKRKVRMRN
jgi:hypothetical protein